VNPANKKGRFQELSKSTFIYHSMESLSSLSSKVASNGLSKCVNVKIVMLVAVSLQSKNDKARQERLYINRAYYIVV